MKQVYQFCVSYENTKVRGLYDGIATTDNKILTIEDYRSLKEIIYPSLKDSINSWEDMNIVSMCYLGEIQEDHS